MLFSSLLRRERQGVLDTQKRPCEEEAEPASSFQELEEARHGFSPRASGRRAILWILSFQPRGTDCGLRVSQLRKDSFLVHVLRHQVCTDLLQQLQETSVLNSTHSHLGMDSYGRNWGEDIFDYRRNVWWTQVSGYKRGDIFCVFCEQKVILGLNLSLITTRCKLGNFSKSITKY